MRYDAWYENEFGKMTLMPGILADSPEGVCEYVAKMAFLAEESTIFVYPRVCSSVFSYRSKPEWERIR